MSRLRPFRLVSVIAAVIALSACVAQRIAERPELGPPTISPTKLRTLGPAPIRAPEASFAFAPVENVPGTFVYAMEDAIKAHAPSRSLTIVADDAAATYRVKGYLSAVGDFHRVLLVYVWDVFDAAGNRVHRISGQEPAPGGSADPWTAVTDAMINITARETVDALADWVRG